MQQTDDDSIHDLIVVGAGLSGLVAAARYLQVHPDSNVVILEQDYCLGGVWSERKNYPSFWTHWAYGTAEFADMAMTRPPAEDSMNDLFKAKYTTRYLEDYADFIRVADRSLRNRIWFKTRVETITKFDGRWYLSCIRSTGPATIKTFTTAKLMVANGLASIPRYPDLPGQQDFHGTVLHSVDFGENNVISNDKIQHVAVLGGGKSAADMVYEAAKAGKTVSWIIRKTGDESTGPGFFAPADAPTPYRNVGEMAQTRLMASLQPCFMNEDTWWTRFLHRTRIGISLVRAIFAKADEALQKRAAYKERDKSNGFDKLQYETSLFWQNGVGGVLHFADFYDLVAAKVVVYRARVKKLTDKELYLDDDDNTNFPCDAILCGTGWKQDSGMFNDKLRIELGLPYRKELESSETTAKWKELDEQADSKMLEQFPILRNPPAHTQLTETDTPYRLYRGMAPLFDDTILFMNHVTVSNKLFGAEAQAMWAVAYFDRKIIIPPVTKREENVSMWVAWCRRRYLSNGQSGNYVGFDGVPYVDILLADMEVSAHRRKGWVRNFFAPFLPADLGRAWIEYQDRQ